MFTILGVLGRVWYKIDELEALSEGNTSALALQRRGAPSLL